jgi:copper oxidase (laccase) domain-containing protein
VTSELCVGLEHGHVEVRFSNRAHGDLNADVVAPHVVDRRWRVIADRPVSWLDEVHGTDVVLVDAPGAATGRRGDGMVTAVAGAALGIWVGDCAPVALVAAEGVVGAAHAGWRGLEAGLLAEVVAAMRRLGAGEITAVLGPCLHVECNEFGPADLDRLVARFGSEVAGTTAWETPAFDLPAGVRAALAVEGVELAPVRPPCTGCDAQYWSHRARAERERHGMAVWLEAA